MPASADLLGRRPAGRLLPTLLLVLTVFGPISMDLYLPVLPALTDELGAATSVAQLTVTACLIGLALGVTTVVCVALSAAACARGRTGGYRAETGGTSPDVLVAP